MTGERLCIGAASMRLSLGFDTATESPYGLGNETQTGVNEVIVKSKDWTAHIKPKREGGFQVMLSDCHGDCWYVKSYKTIDKAKSAANEWINQ